MGERKFRFHDAKTGAAVSVHVESRGTSSKILGISSGGTIRVQLIKNSPLEENKLLIKLFSDVLEIKSVKIEVIDGLSGSEKIITVLDNTADQIQNKLLAYMENT